MAEATKVVSTQAEVDALNKAQGNVLVKPREDVLVEWTAKANHHKKGAQSTVHRIQAERFVKQGIATIVKKDN